MCMCCRFYMEWKDRDDVLTENGNQYQTNSVVS